MTEQLKLEHEYIDAGYVRRCRVCKLRILLYHQVIRYTRPNDWYHLKCAFDSAKGNSQLKARAEVHGQPRCNAECGNRIEPSDHVLLFRNPHDTEIKVSHVMCLHDGYQPQRYTHLDHHLLVQPPDST